MYVTIRAVTNAIFHISLWESKKWFNIKKTEKKINREKGYNNFKKKCKPLKKHEMQLEKP